jgi:hypothetical protein
MTNRRTYRTDSYFNEMYDDVLEYIAENIDLADYIEDGEFDRESLEDKLNDDCFVADSVTGNASGSYYCNAYRAAEKVHSEIDLLIEAIECFGDDAEDYKRALKSPEYADVTIRCYYLGEVVARVLDDIEEAYDEAGAGVELSEILETVKGA